MTRKQFIRKIGVSAAVVGVAAAGFGKSARAAAIPNLDQPAQCSGTDCLHADTGYNNLLQGLCFNYGYELAAQDPAAFPFLQVSANKYLCASCKASQLSPIPDWQDVQARCNPTFVDCGDFAKWIPASADFYLDMSGNLIFWNMDPITGFTDAMLGQFLNQNGNIIVPNPMPGIESISLRDIARVQALLSMAGLDTDTIPPQVIAPLGKVPRPDSKVDSSGAIIQQWEDGYKNKELGFLFPDDRIRKLGKRTSLVEFTVPASPFQEGMFYNNQFVPGAKQVVSEWIIQYLMNQNGLTREQAVGYVGSRSPYLMDASPKTEYKLRGWFIKGDGVENGAGKKRYPLVIYSHGHEGALGRTGDVSLADLEPLLSLANAGYSVLFYDFEGCGYSEGWNRVHDFGVPSAGTQLYVPNPTSENPFGWAPYPGVAIPEPQETGNAPNIFHILSQLSGGEQAPAVLGPDGVKHDDRLIEADAPVILYGISHGSFISTKAMQLNSEKDMGFNLRGVMESDGMGGSSKYVGDAGLAPTVFWLCFEAVRRREFNSGYHPSSEVLDSAEKWPGYLGMKAAYDFLTVESTINLYNRVKKNKGLILVAGWHNWGLLVDPNLDYTMEKMLEWCEKAVFSSSSDTTKTSLTEQLCSIRDKLPSKPVAERNSYPRPFGLGNSVNQLKEHVKRYAKRKR